MSIFRALVLATGMFLLTLGQLAVLIQKSRTSMEGTCFGLTLVAMGSALIGLSVFGPGW